MAAAQGLYAESVSNVDASTTAWVDVCTISAASFTTGKKYLIIANAFCTSVNSSANEVRMRLVHGTTPTLFDDASLAFEITTGDVQGASMGWMTVFTQPGTTELVKLQVSNSSTSTSRCQLGQIFALNLDDVGTQNTDWFYTEDLVDYSTTASKVSKASVTFTPNGTDDWLIIGNCSRSSGAATSNYLADINDSVAGILMSLDIEGEDATNEVRGHLLMAVVTPTNASHTFSIRFSHESTAGTVFSNRIFALNLNKFRNHAFSTAAADDAPAASPSWTTTRTVSPTPDVTGDWFVWGALGYDVGTLTDSLGTRLQINPSGGGLASNPNYGDDMPKDDSSWDATDEIPIHLFKMLSLTSGAARACNLDAQRIAGTTLTAQQRTLVAFSLELPAGGTQYNQSVSGTLTTAGLLVKQDSKILPATLTTAGGLVKQTGKVLSGILSSSGALVKRTSRILSGTLTSSGAFVASKVALKSLSGTLTSAGSLVNRAQKILSGTVTSSGLLVKQTSRNLSGALTSSGTLASTKVALLSLVGTLTSSGLLQKSTSKILSGVLTSIGSLTKQDNKTVGGVLSTSGLVVKRTQKILSGILSTAGNLQAVFQSGGFSQSVGGTLTLAGSLVKSTSTSLTGSLLSSGGLTKQVSKLLVGVLTSSGVLTSLKVATSIVSGTLTTSGTLVKSTFHTISGSLTPVGVLTKSVVVSAFQGTLSFVGALASAVIPSAVAAGGIIRGVVRSIARPLAFILAQNLKPTSLITPISVGFLSQVDRPGGVVTQNEKPSATVES